MQKGGNIPKELYEGIAGIIIGIVLLVVAIVAGTMYESYYVKWICGFVGGIILFFASASAFQNYELSQRMDASNIVGGVQTPTSLVL